MVWGTLVVGKWVQGTHSLYRHKGIFNMEGYHSILQHHAILCGQHVMEPTPFYRIMTLTITPNRLQLFRKEAVICIRYVMEWSAHPPDLNHTELVWEQLYCMVPKKCLSSQSNMWEVLQEAWSEITSIENGLQGGSKQDPPKNPYYVS